LFFTITASNKPPSKPPLFFLPSARKPGGADPIAKTRQITAPIQSKGKINPHTTNIIVNMEKKLLIFSLLPYMVLAGREKGDD